MTKELVYGPNGTPVAGVTSLDLPLAVLNHEDFIPMVESATEAIYKDGTSPMDQDSVFRVAQRERANIYSGTSIDQSVFLPSRKGVDTVVELVETWAVTDSDDPAFLLQFPVRSAWTFTVPRYAMIGGQNLLDLAGRNLAFALPQGAVNATRLEEILRGGLKL